MSFFWNFKEFYPASQIVRHQKCDTKMKNKINWILLGKLENKALPAMNWDYHQLFLHLDKYIVLLI